MREGTLNLPFFLNRMCVSIFKQTKHANFQFMIFFLAHALPFKRKKGYVKLKVHYSFKLGFILGIPYSGIADWTIVPTPVYC